ncbi:MAG: cyclomaltodextrinase N-terminal domain-containing protein [Bacteroidales bacterium]|nr:cyclomaltodextrinase N-terminal domain-containing protein [Bacteroidales bacterium]
MLLFITLLSATLQAEPADKGGAEIQRVELTGSEAEVPRGESRGNQEYAERVQIYGTHSEVLLVKKLRRQAEREEPINSPTGIERVEPPNWWTGMEHPSLQLLVKGDNIGGSRVSLSYPGVTLYSVTYPPSPDYLFINLLIDPSAQPGTFTVTLSDSNVTVAEFEYSLLEREDGSAMRQGFDMADTEVI